MDCNGKNLCRGILCHTFKKEVRCCKCGVWLCKVCDLRIKNRTFCIDCYVKEGVKDLKDLFKINATNENKKGLDYDKNKTVY